MPGPRATPVKLTDMEKTALEYVITTGTKYTILKAKVLLAVAQGKTTTAISKELAVSSNSVVRWKREWNESTILPKNQDEAFEKIFTILEKTAGRPKKCEEEQLDKIVEIAGWREKEYRSRHAHNELIAIEAVRRGIVPEISPRTVGRLLEEYRKQKATSS
jgi:transposase